MRWGGFFYILELNLLTSALVAVLFLFACFTCFVYVHRLIVGGLRWCKGNDVPVSQYQGCVVRSAVGAILVAVVCGAMSAVTAVDATFSEAAALFNATSMTMPAVSKVTTTAGGQLLSNAFLWTFSVPLPASFFGLLHADHLSAQHHAGGVRHRG